MICPCKDCPDRGCGERHDSCEPFRIWKKERDETNRWLKAHTEPPISEAGIKGKNERLRRGKSRKWNLKNQYNRGDS